MNKRARLARRILREHRRGVRVHLTRQRWDAPSQSWGERWSVYDFWRCTHCSGWSLLIPKGVPGAYR